jgi:formylglycine-generating enzyme required for sulfatase activity
LPLENVSWDEITRDGGFLDRMNRSPVRAAIVAKVAPHMGVLRLPSETEWEYAARGGLHWTDGFRFSGSDDIGAVAWHDRKDGDHTRPVGLGVTLPKIFLMLHQPAPDGRFRGRFAPDSPLITTAAR